MTAGRSSGIGSEHLRAKPSAQIQVNAANHGKATQESPTAKKWDIPQWPCQAPDFNKAFILSVTENKTKGRKTYKQQVHYRSGKSISRGKTQHNIKKQLGLKLCTLWLIHFKSTVLVLWGKILKSVPLYKNKCNWQCVIYTKCNLIIDWFPHCNIISTQSGR